MKVIVSARQYIEYFLNKRKLSFEEAAVPPTVCLMIPCFFKYIKNKSSGTKFLKLNHPLFKTMIKSGEKVAILESQIGSPLIATQIEEMRVLGAKQIIHLGLAGSLNERVNTGDFILSSGTFYESALPSCYFQKSELLLPYGELHKRLEACMLNKNINFCRGLNFATDAVFRESLEKVEKYKNLSVITVEMEAAGLYSVCNYYKMPVAALYVISDTLFKNKWGPHFFEEKLDNRIKEISLQVTEILQELYKREKMSGDK